MALFLPSDPSDEGYEQAASSGPMDWSFLKWPEPEPQRSGNYLKDYEEISRIGRGAFGLVWHVRERSTGRDLAVKKCIKDYIKRYGCEQSIMRERMAMVKMDHHFIIKLVKAFQDLHFLYFVMELQTGALGDEFVKYGAFRNEVTRFYTAEIIMALEYLRHVRVVHRDLKMMNVLLDQRKHIKLTDFGCCVFVEGQDPNVSRRQQWRQNRPNLHTREGTRFYFAPEVIAEGPVSYGADLWALGCMLYEMHTGNRPFGPKERLLTLIPTCNYATFPMYSDPSLENLVAHLLVFEPEQRLGFHDLTDLKMHPFYGTRDPASWELLHTVDPPPIVYQDPRARTDSTDRPFCDIFFQPATDTAPASDQLDQSVYEGFDTTPEEEEQTQPSPKPKKKCFIS